MRMNIVVGIGVEHLEVQDELKSELLLPNGKLKLLPANHYDKFDWPALRLFCHLEARYGLPTLELVEYLKNIIAGRTAIEIGAGHGDLGYHLGIHATDSKIQQRADIKAKYDATGQPTIQYPDDVEKLEALEAVERYKPQVVIGSWITEWIPPYETRKPGSHTGVKEDVLLTLVDTYILIGNQDTHEGKPIFNSPHESVKFACMRSRASNPEGDRIYIWNK